MCADPLAKLRDVLGKPVRVFQSTQAVVLQNSRIIAIFRPFLRNFDSVWIAGIRHL